MLRPGTSKIRNARARAKPAERQGKTERVEMIERERERAEMSELRSTGARAQKRWMQERSSTRFQEAWWLLNVEYSPLSLSVNCAAQLCTLPAFKFTSLLLSFSASCGRQRSSKVADEADTHTQGCCFCITHTFEYDPLYIYLHTHTHLYYNIAELDIILHLLHRILRFKLKLPFKLSAEKDFDV